MTYFSKINLGIGFLDYVYPELERGVFQITKTYQLRLELNKQIKKQVQNYIPYEISDCGILKNTPGWKYPIHRDQTRTCAINILLCERDADFVVNFYSDDRKNTFILDYERHQPYLLNTKKLHSVTNMSTSKTRLVLTIGNTKDSYEEVLKNLIL